MYIFNFFCNSVTFLKRLRFYLNRRVYILMANLFQILNQFETIFRKNSNRKKRFILQALLRVKINTRISDTPCICMRPE
jgi:hypothetical protein